MTDQWVLASQQWLNSTFGNVDGWTTVTEDGLTGQGTENGLIEGLQSLLGISPVVPSFGPTTWADLQAHGAVDASDGTTWVTLVQAALYCKGYDGAGLLGVWNDSIESVQEFSNNLGLSADVSSVGLTPKTFRALLNTDPSVLIAGGTDEAREAQQFLNASYTGHDGFLYNATGGVFDRTTQQNLVKGIQYALGQSDSEADGIFGPTTGQELQDDPAALITVGSSGTDCVYLFKAAVIFNGYLVAFNDTFTTTDSAVVKTFQEFEGFTTAEQTGIGDYTTWAELLVSTGDPTRPGTAADMASTITSDRAAALVAAGYKIVGRYLTNEQVPDPLDKDIKPGELDTIFGAGLALFPIFEEGGYELSWFTASQGADDAGRAFTAAQAYGIPDGTIIYFAVDVDVIEAEVQADVIPYFEALNTQMAVLGGTYGIGIYGSRNTCTLVRNAGLSRSSFVAGLSTGYSGNLGYPLPVDWAFNQIESLAIGSGDGAVDIDKDIASGRDPGITSVFTPGNPRAVFFSWVDAIQAFANQWVATGNATTTAARLVLQYMRAPSYGNGKVDGNGPEWSIVAGPLDEGFITLVDGSELVRVTSFVEPSFHAVAIDPEHLAAAADATIQNPIDSSGDVNLGDGAGWAGDLLQVTAQWQQGFSNQDIGTWALQYIADTNPCDRSKFDVGDFFEDVDGYLLGVAIALSPEGTPTNQIIRSFYAGDGGWMTRFADMFALRYRDSETGLGDVTTAVYSQTDASWLAFRTALLIDQNGNPFTLTAEQAEGVIDAYVETFDIYRNSESGSSEQPE